MKRMIKYISGTVYLKLALELLSLALITWWLDASFAVNPYFISQTGAGYLLDKLVVTSMLGKHHISTKTFTEADVVGVDDAAL